MIRLAPVRFRQCFVSLYPVTPAGVAAPDAVWLGGRFESGSLATSIATVDRWYAGETSPDPRQTAITHSIEFQRGWFLPTDILADALPSRGDFALELVFQDPDTRRWHRRRYLGVQWSSAGWQSDGGLHRVGVSQRFTARNLETDDGLAAFISDPSAFIGVAASFSGATPAPGTLLSGLYSCSERCQLGAVAASATGGTGVATLRLERDGVPVDGAVLTLPAGAGLPVSGAIANLALTVSPGTKLRWRVLTVSAGTPVSAVNLAMAVQPLRMISAP